MNGNHFSRKTKYAGIIAAIMIAGILVSACVGAGESQQGNAPTAATTAAATIITDGRIVLPSPDHSTATTLDYALENRRSVREYSNRSLSAGDLSLLLWSGQGITDNGTGKRTAPSAMRTYPLTLYVAVTSVENIPEAVYTYEPATHSLNRHLDDAGKESLLTSIGQKQALSAPVTIVVGANYTTFLERMRSEDEVIQHASLEAGHVVQNILLMETSRGIAGVPFTGFNMTAAGETLSLPENHHVIYAVTAGYPAS